MSWSDSVIAALAATGSWAYHARGPSASEPAALSALALLAHGLSAEAEPALEWLSTLQAADGSIGIMAAQATPGWPTGQAVLAWSLAQQQPRVVGRYQNQIDRAVHWILSTSGVPLQKTEELGHDSTLIGWPWVESTHSWIEPTAWNVLALKAVGRSDHPRTREGVQLLVDRLLPQGGCNYGNTFVLGQELRPHLQPTGVCLMALAGERTNDARIAMSLDYLVGRLSEKTATASLSYGLLGLASHGHEPTQADAWLAAAAHRTLTGDNGAHRLSLLALAALGDACPLLSVGRVEQPS